MIAAVVLAAGLMVAGSRGAWLLGGVGVATLAALRGGTRIRVGILGAVSTCVVVGLAWGPPDALRAFSIAVDPMFGATAELDGGRHRIWRHAVGVLWAAPLVGTGPEGFGDAFNAVGSFGQFTTVTQAHQDWQCIAWDCTNFIRTHSPPCPVNKFKIICVCNWDRFSCCVLINKWH